MKIVNVKSPNELPLRYELFSGDTKIEDVVRIFKEKHKKEPENIFIYNPYSYKGVGVIAAEISYERIGQTSWTSKKE